MSQELQLGKYEFYPYEFDKSPTPTLEELLELLKKAKAKTDKDVKRPLEILTDGEHALNDWLSLAKRGRRCVNDDG